MHSLHDLRLIVRINKKVGLILFVAQITLIFFQVIYILNLTHSHPNALIKNIRLKQVFSYQGLS